MIGKNLKKKINLTIAFNALYAKNEKKYIMPWKSNSKREERVIILMNPNKEGLYYIAIKNSALLRQITSKHSSDYYFLNYIHLFKTRRQA